jgi:DNA-binding SARP family transcriptional activator/class 3 adenylate cyclase
LSAVYGCLVVHGGEQVIEFRILGPLQVVSEGRVLPLGGRKQRALLALLLLDRNHVVPRDRLVDALWGDRPPASAANSVQVYVSKLRRLLDEGTEDGSALLTESPGYLLRVPTGSLDADEFERLVAEANIALAAGSFAEAETTLARALELWRGPALADLATEAFARPDVARLEDLRLQALEARFEAMLSVGRQAEAVGELQALVGFHPLDERLRAQLMVALYRSGRQADALDTYRTFRRLLSDELGLEPSPKLRTLEQSILRQDESLAPVVEPGAPDMPAEAPPTPRAEPRPIEDERRPVTVLFADIVGSTALGEQLEPDEAKVLVGECVTMMSRAVDEYGGVVQAFQGDGICAYFGVPAAHEDDPERAARTALRILEVVDGYARDIESAWGISGFAVRVGVNSGPAAVGLVGTIDPQAVALGDATNVAARLQAAAEPGTILVGQTTARRLADRFALEPVGEITVKGREEPVAASRLVRAKEREPRVPTTPLVDRDRELEQLRSVVDDLAAGRGRIVLVEGAPGIGKTRLLAALATLSSDSATWLEGQCHSYGGLPCWPFVEALLGWLGAEIGEPEIAIRTKARAGFGALLGDDLDPVLLPLAALLRLRFEPAGAPSADEIDRAYLRWLEALARERPVVLAVEDSHWADSRTRQLGESLLELTDRAPVAIVFTAEPIPGSEGAALRLRALADFAHRTTEIALRPISDEAAEVLLAAYVGDALDRATRIGLIREAEGNPLYLEELSRAFLEGALEPRGRTWTVTIGSLELLTPTLENLLVARIDRQPDGPRRLAQIAAAIGRTFPVPVLAAVAGDPIDEPLRALLRAEIVREVSRYPELECTFTHGLLREAVLSTLTSARKRTLYASIAEAFESIYADSLDEHLERLAHYHAQAGALPKALAYAERARAGSAAGGTPLTERR